MPNPQGTPIWYELMTPDVAAAKNFYGAVTGWTFTDDCGDARLGATMDRASDEQPLKWTFYFHVPDVDAAVEQVKAGGGQLVMGPMDVPGGQRIIVVIDPQGLSVGFVSGERA